MPTAAPLVYYPQYCFHLSPTINTWCPLRAVDIAGLECRPGFEDIDVYFSLNHPVRWVRVVGVVVAIDDYYGYRVYTVDDSTGKCIECALSVPADVANKLNYRDNGHGKAAGQQTGATTATTTKTPFPYDIDVGMTVDVKGSVKLFRGQKQMKIQKITQVLSTNQEVLFWDKIRNFRQDVLSQPWVLNDREVRRCRKLQQMDAVETAEKRAKRKARECVERTGLSKEGRGRDPTSSRESRPRNGAIVRASPKASRTTDAIRREILKARISNGKKYDALGL